MLLFHLALRRYLAVHLCQYLTILSSAFSSKFAVNRTLILSMYEMKVRFKVKYDVVTEDILCT